MRRRSLEPTNTGEIGQMGQSGLADALLVWQPARPSDDGGRPVDSPRPQPHREVGGCHWSPRCTIDVCRGWAEALWQREMTVPETFTSYWRGAVALAEGGLVGQGCTGELTHARYGFKAQLARPKRHSVCDKCCSSLGPPSQCKYKSPVQPPPWSRQSINYKPSRGTVTRQNRNSASTEQLLYDNSSFVCSVCGLAAPKEGGSASR